jgi:hypothetical protein
MGPSSHPVYDAETNPDNLFFSSPVSFLVLLNTSVNYRFTPRLTLRVAGSYNHISNSGYSEPNLGMNFPSVSAGLDYSFNPIDLPKREPSDSRNIQTKKQRIDVVVGLSAKPTTSGLHEKRYPVYVLGMNYSRSVARILALNGSVEWVNDRSLYRALRENGTVNGAGNFPDHNRVGLLREWTGCLAGSSFTSSWGSMYIHP